MVTKALLFLAAVPLSLACSSSAAPDDNHALIVPQDVQVMIEEGGAGVLTLYALTLTDGPDGLQIYAALKNDGDTQACDVAFKGMVYDKAGQSVTSFINGLQTRNFYLYMPDATTTTVAACVSVGDIGMASVDTMASNIKAADVGKVVYYYSYFALDAVLVDGLTVTTVNPMAGSGGTSYTGTVLNQLSFTASNPTISIFPLNHVGRPLGLATTTDATSQVAPGATWSFQTGTVETLGEGYAAFPSADFGN